MNLRKRSSIFFIYIQFDKKIYLSHLNITQDIKPSHVYIEIISCSRCPQINMVAYIMMLRLLWSDGSSTAIAIGRKNINNTIVNAEERKKIRRQNFLRKVTGSIGSCFVLCITWITGFLYMSDSKCVFLFRI